MPLTRLHEGAKLDGLLQSQGHLMTAGVKEDSAGNEGKYAAGMIKPIRALTLGVDARI